MRYWIILIVTVMLMKEIYSVMLKQECGADEVHKSCSFTDENFCWENKDKVKRIKVLPKRRSHCKQGCFCRKGFVREYPKGRCIPAMRCQDQNLIHIIKNIPVEYGNEIRFNKFNTQD